MLKAILLLSFFAADEKEAEDALVRFKEAYKGAAAARAAAVKDLARVQHEKTLAKLEGILGGEEMPVRIEAARGLGNFTDYKKKVTPALLGVLGTTTKDTVALAEAVFEA